MFKFWIGIVVCWFVVIRYALLFLASCASAEVSSDSNNDSSASFAPPVRSMLHSYTVHGEMATEWPAGQARLTRLQLAPLWRL